MDKKKEKPSVMPCELYCHCGLVGIFFMTLKERESKPIIRAWCKKCNEITKFTTRKGGFNE
jgi:hypothetical protein